MKSKRILSAVMVIIMALGLPLALHAQGSAGPVDGYTHDGYLADAMQQVRPLEPDLARVPSLEAIDGRGLSRVRASEVSTSMAFEIYRVQLAVDMGMELETFLFGDVGLWVDDYLEQWRRDNGVVMSSYDGPMAVRIDPETGRYYAYSMRTFEFVYSRIQCQEELGILQKVTFLRAPYVFYSQVDTSERALNALMYQTIGIRSVDELLDVAPLALLESYMVEASLSFADIGGNWATASSDVAQFDAMSRDNAGPDPAPISPLLPAETRDMLEAMAQLERDGVDARYAMQMLVDQGIIAGEHLEESGMRNQSQWMVPQPFISSPSISPLFNPPHSRVSNTTIWPYNSVAQIYTHFTVGGSLRGSAFYVGPGQGRLILTAAHLLRDFDSFGSRHASFLEVSPGRDGNWFPFGRQGGQTVHDFSVIISHSWNIDRNMNYDWAVINVRHPLNGIGLHLSGAFNPQDFAGRPNRVVGFPRGSNNNNHFMYHNTGDTFVFDLGRPAIVGTRNFAMPGYSGAPVFCPSNWVIGIHVAGYEGTNHVHIVRITPELFDLVHSVMWWSWWP